MLFGKIATKFQNSFLTLGFPQSTIEQLGEFLAELEQPEETNDTDSGEEVVYRNFNDSTQIHIVICFVFR